MQAHWQSEKDAISSDPRRRRKSSRTARSQIETLERAGDLAGAAEIQYGSVARARAASRRPQEELDRAPGRRARC